MLIQEKKYKEYLANDYEPVDETSMPYLVDIRAIKAYADGKGVSIVSLTDDENKRRIARCLLWPNDGSRLAVRLTVEIGGKKEMLAAFTNADKFSSYLGVCPANNESG